MSRLATVIIVAILTGVIWQTASAQEVNEPGWTGRVLKVGQDRARTEAMPITKRPYRPFHFYGNTVRRMYYRGQALPRPKDFAKGSKAMVLRGNRR